MLAQKYRRRLPTKSAKCGTGLPTCLTLTFSEKNSNHVKEIDDILKMSQCWQRKMRKSWRQNRRKLNNSVELRRQRTRTELQLVYTVQ